MPTTREAVLAALAPDEIDYDRAARHLGADAVPVLLELVEQADPRVAPKAAHLAGLIPGAHRAQVARVAAASPDPVTRIAGAALAARLEPEVTVELLDGLLQDADAGVRKHALLAARTVRTAPRMQARLESLSRSEPEPQLRSAAAEYLRPG